MFSTFIKQYKLRCYGIYIDAYTNKDGQIKKNTAHPMGDKLNKDKEQTSNNYFGSVYSRTQRNFVKPNGIAIITTHSNISSLDVDKPEQCIILDRLLEDCNLVVKTRKGYHFYFNKEEILPRNDCNNGIIDINTDILFYCPEYKHIETGEVFKYEIIKNAKKLNDMPDYAIEYCKTLISITKNTQVEKTKQKVINKQNMIIQPDLEINKFNLKTLDSIFDIFYHSKDSKGNGMFETYQGWRDIGFMARHLNNSYEALELYNSYCIKVEKFKNSTINDNAKGFYGNNDYNTNFDENAILYKCCKLDRNKYAKTLKHLEVNKYENTITKFNTQYIKPIDGCNDFIFNDWINNYKILCLKSAYGTGKTYTFKKLIDEANINRIDKEGNSIKVDSKMPRILFITYRQSLANSLSKDLKENYGFTNYLDINSGCSYSMENRLILQLDSIYKLNNTYENNDLIQMDDDNDLDPSNFYDVDDIMKNNTYDLLVLDEMEGILNHLSFNKINQFQIHNKLVNLIETSKKVLVLDGDLGNRTLDFITDITDSYKVYENEYKPNKKHFQFTHEKKYFDIEIENDINNGLKIVIVSMTKTQTVKYHDEYTLLGKKCIIHNSLTKNKEILEDVNENWKDCDLLTYSPSVESGVDFNIVDHFDKCYAIVESRSTSYRAFCQMLNRVRHYKQHNIICLMPNDMRYKLDDVLIRFDEIKLQKYKGLEITNLLNVLIHNDVERYNSKNYFITALCGMLEKKGHTYEELTQDKIVEILKIEANKIINDDKIQHLLDNGTPLQINTIGALIEDIPNPVINLFELRNVYREEVLERANMINGVRTLIKGKDAIVKAIFNSKTLTEMLFNDLLKRQQSNQQITDDELLSINKMIYKKVFKFWTMEDMTRPKLDLIYNNIENVKNYDNLLFNQKSSNTIDRLVKDDKDVLGNFEMTKLINLNNLLQNLGFEFNNDIILKHEKLNFEDSKDMLIEFVKKHKTLYNCERTFKAINWLKCINDILGNYGLEAIKCKKQKRDGDKIIVDYEIELTKNDILDLYVKNYRQYYTNLLNDCDKYKAIENKLTNDITKMSRYDLKQYYKKLSNEEQTKKYIKKDITNTIVEAEAVAIVAKVEQVAKVAKVAKVEQVANVVQPIRFNSFDSLTQEEQIIAIQHLEEHIKQQNQEQEQVKQVKQPKSKLKLKKLLKKMNINIDI
jgi:hypothetical protein